MTIESGTGCGKAAPVTIVSLQGLTLRELVRTNDVVLVSAIGALLDGAGIGYLVLDQNMSIIEGSLGIIPRRILVRADDLPTARGVLSDAGLAHELRDG